MDTEVTTPPDINAILGQNGKHARMRWMRTLSSSVVLALLAVVGLLIDRGRSTAATYITQRVATGDLVVAVSATGTLEPRNQVDIGSELSGTIGSVKVGPNDAVWQGQLLATLDTSRLNAQLLQAQGSVFSAEARERQSTAVLTEASGTAARLLRLHELSGSRVPSQQDLEVAQAAVDRARGDVAAARAAVAQARASRDAVQTNLSKSEIRSPINGVVLMRSIEPGQSVAASLRSPVLFRLAEDLRYMELRVWVAEADVGSVKVGQPASFTVRAFPARSFEARVTRVHMASSNMHSATSGTRSGDQPATSSTDVVTYETALEVENSELLLRPGMTATVEIMTGNLHGITLVPNAAMRFTPQRAQLPDLASDKERRTGMMALVPHFAEQWQCPRENGQALGCVWVLENGEPQLVMFRPGATDQWMTQALPLEQLPNWSSLTRLRKDPVFLRALKRNLTPGTQVIVAGAAYQ